MILKGSQRAGARELAYHLLNTRDNDHITVHEVSGFVSDDVVEALNEAYAISQATRCRQFLFSLSLNPPEGENVSIRDFETAIAKAEERLGLCGQPRAVIFHEKEDRRHAHCVWNRIDISSMTAIQLSHYKNKLTSLSQELYLEHDWVLPAGLRNWQERTAEGHADDDVEKHSQAQAVNFSLAEWQQAKRAKADPRELKRIFQDCWKQSDGRGAFQSALAEQGYILARGDRRGHVAVDWRGEVYAVSRWVCVKAKHVRDRFGELDGLPTVSQAKAMHAEQETQKLEGIAQSLQKEFTAVANAYRAKRTQLVSEQRTERRKLKSEHEGRRIAETRRRALRLPTGLKALWFRLTGRYAQIKQQNEIDFEQFQQRDEAEWQALVERHLQERRQLKMKLESEKEHFHRQGDEIDQAKEALALDRDIASALSSPDM
ncbi:MAG: relaxase/mobilization nuclease domain-containing protein [Pseudomonadota bacterium]